MFAQSSVCLLMRVRLLNEISSGCQVGFNTSVPDLQFRWKFGRNWIGCGLHGVVTGWFLLSKQICQFSDSSSQICFFWIWDSVFGLQSYWSQMLPCLSPCVRSKLTHQLLGDLNTTIPNLWNIPVTVAIWEAGFETWQNSFSEFLVEQSDFKG